MDKAALSTLVDYNFWANARILAACERLPAEAFTRAVTPDPGWGSLRGILVHALDTEYGWRATLQDLGASGLLRPEAFADVAALKARWAEERAAWLAYLDGLRPEALPLGANPNAQLKVWETIVHIILHGAQHRGEAAAILTGYGQSPGEIDFDAFLVETSR